MTEEGRFQIPKHVWGLLRQVQVYLTNVMVGSNLEFGEARTNPFFNFLKKIHWSIVRHLERPFCDCFMLNTLLDLKRTASHNSRHCANLD